jgi:hypothetical protein
MKLSLTFLAIAMFVMIVPGFAQTASPADPDKAKMDSITRRVRSGDKAAILEEANIRPDISVPALRMAARDKSTDPQRAEIARQALSRIKGVEDYLKQKIDDASARKTSDAAFERGTHMETLALVRTNKAIRTIASYLFDDKTPGYAGEGYGIPSNKVGAAMTLDDMKVPGASSTDFTDYDKHVVAWRAWWLKNQNKFDDASPYQGKQ